MDNSVRELRETKGLTQAQLGEALGVSRQSVNSIEKGKYDPSLPLAIAIARYFGRTVEEVFHAGEPQPGSARVSRTGSAVAPKITDNELITGEPRSHNSAN